MTLSVNLSGDTGTENVFRGNDDSPNYMNCFDDLITRKQNFFDLFGEFQVGNTITGG